MYPMTVVGFVARDGASPTVARAGVQRHRLQTRITTLAIISSAVMAMVNIRTSTVARLPAALFDYLESARNKIDGR
jgi:hypothetical protein